MFVAEQPVARTLEDVALIRIEDTPKRHMLFDDGGPAVRQSSPVVQHDVQSTMTTRRDATRRSVGLTITLRRTRPGVEQLAVADATSRRRNSSRSSDVERRSPPDGFPSDAGRSFNRLVIQIEDSRYQRLASLLATTSAVRVLGVAYPG